MFGGRVGESKVVKILENRIAILERRETDLLNRLMARNYGEYVLGQDVVNEKLKGSTEYPEDTMEENAGEAMEMETE